MKTRGGGAVEKQQPAAEETKNRRGITLGAPESIGFQTET